MGLTGILDVRIVSTTRVAERGSEFISGEALCDSTEVVLGGGFSVSEHAQGIGKVVQNAPIGGTNTQRHGWKSTLVLETAGQKEVASDSITIFAICAEVPDR